MDVREKLVKLVEYVDGVCPSGVSCYNCSYKDIGEGCSIQAKVDYLIKGGVTVQEWISVKDMLPEDNSNVIACLWIGEESRVYPAFYAHGVWWDRVFSTPTTNTTTHWQPMPKLPQPPKGE